MSGNGSLDADGSEGRERGGEREREGGGEREREKVCVGLGGGG